jgi:signal peptidase II
VTDEQPTTVPDSTSTRPVPNRRRFAIIAGAIVLGVLLADQLTKIWAVAALTDGPVNVFGDTVQFALTRNPGSAFSLFQGFTPVLAVIAVVIAVVLIRMLRSATDPWMVVGLALVLGGALGNLTDRIARADGFLNGAVIDFVKVGWWPSFNIADAALTVGVAIIIVRSFRRS